MTHCLGSNGRCVGVRALKRVSGLAGGRAGGRLSGLAGGRVGDRVGWWADGLNSLIIINSKSINTGGLHFIYLYFSISLKKNRT